MEKNFKEILESELLNDQTRAVIQEAWDSKINETRAALREEVETQIREEYANRFAQDKSDLVEAMDRMLTDAVRKHAGETAAATRAVAEQRKVLAQRIQETNTKFAQDKAALTEHVERMLTRAVRENAERTLKQTQALKTARAALTQSVRESRREYRDKLAQNLKMVESFVFKQLTQELAEVSRDHRAMQGQRIRLAREISEARSASEARLKETTQQLQGFVITKLTEQMSQLSKGVTSLNETRSASLRKLREHRMELNQHTQSSMLRLEQFVVEQLQREIQELHEDKRNLVEARVRMATESKAKMAETRRAFIERASKLVESTVESHLRKEMTQLKDDLREARENLFGRRLFEAFQSEFMTSYLSEGTKVKQLTVKLAEAESREAAVRAQVARTQQLAESMQRRVQLAESRAQRERTMNDLLGPLAKEKRAVMGELLENTRTESLKEAFHKYLPAVLNETALSGRRTLTDASPSVTRRVTAVTGNRPNNRLAESVRAEDVSSTANEIIELRRLAGLEK